MTTRRLYFDDSWLFDFRARVVAIGELAGAPSVLLDQSAFYPEGGGQLGDRGHLGDTAIRDVQASDDGRVHHLVADGAPLPAVGAEVGGRLERAWRRVNMALHTGQHMFSRALLSEASAPTVSARLGETDCTIDLERDPIPEAELARALDLCNSVIDDDVPIRHWMPDAAELAAMPLRREPKVQSEVRVVKIGDYDLSPCGGTHCTRSGQVGLVHITQIERKKGHTRVHFAAGPRGRRELSQHSTWLRELGRSMSAGPEAVADAVARLSRELFDARGELKELRRQQAATSATAMLAAARARGDQHLVAAFPDADAELLRELGRQLTAEPDGAGMVCFLAGAGLDGTQVLIARGAASDFDCGVFLRQLAQSCGGRGGGRPEHAEGRLPASIDWPQIVAAARSR